MRHLAITLLLCGCAHQTVMRPTVVSVINPPNEIVLGETKYIIEGKQIRRCTIPVIPKFDDGDGLVISIQKLKNYNQKLLLALRECNK